MEEPAGRFDQTPRYRSSIVGKQGVQVAGAMRQMDDPGSPGVGAVENEVVPKPIHPRGPRAGKVRKLGNEAQSPKSKGRDLHKPACLINWSQENKSG
jgi:hypothetical protein